MLDKIKNNILYVLRNYCGYYELRQEYDSYRKFITKSITELGSLEQSRVLELDKLSTQHEAKILEYDILFAKNEANILERNILDNKIKEFPSLYKKYLVAELEEILNIMKEKGIHPQDLIKRIINKANRDIKE